MFDGSGTDNIAGLPGVRIDSTGVILHCRRRTDSQLFNMEEAVQIIIVYNYWTEFADEENDIYPDDELSTGSVWAARVDDSHFIVRWYTSLGIFGPWGATLNLGDIIEVRLLSDGTYRYLGTTCKNDRIGNVTWSIRMEILDREDLRSLLSRFVDLGACWEGASGNLTIQSPMEERPELEVVTTGNSVEEAVDEALRSLEKGRSDVVVEVLDELERGRARIRVVPLEAPESIRLLIAEVYDFLQENGLMRV